MIISEDHMIKVVMSESLEALSSGDISKKIFIKYNHRITKTTVKNYLWSSLRSQVKCDTENWVYSLKRDVDVLSTPSTFKVKTKINTNNSDFISITTFGDEVICTYRENLKVDEVIKALVELELAKDLREEALKKMNIRIKLNRIDDDNN